MKNPDIRLVVASDLHALLELYRHLHPDDPHLDISVARQMLEHILATGLIQIFVMERGAQFISSCTITIIPNLTRGARPYGLIENVVTHERFRNQGLGQAVLRHAVDNAWAAGCYKVMLATGSRRPETLRFYEGVGFEREGKTCFQMRNPVPTG
jgi:GNAT superfamily N-acetyltransferase